jgi:RES domain
VILWRLLPWRADAAPAEPGGALWFPRELQGGGRHDNPDRYGCLYVSEDPVSTVLEALAPFRGTGVLSAAALMRAGLPLVLARLTLSDKHELIDLDEPSVLLSTELRPSTVATNHRSVTQAYAARLFDEDPEAVGLRWWSTLEAGFANLTLYDRAAQSLSLDGVEPLTLAHAAMRDAAEMLGLSVAG